MRLVTETNVPHEENLSYFGAGDEANAVYQFSLAPLLLYSYCSGNATYLTRWAEALEELPDGCTVLNFLASHDGIGLRPLEGLLSESEVDDLVETMHERGGFASMRDAGNGVQRPYEINIALFSAFGGTPADIPAYVGAHLLLMSFRGIPTLYIHSLLASTNDLANVERTGRTRSINRGHLSLASLRQELGCKGSVRSKVLSDLLAALSTRNAQPAFKFGGMQRVVSTHSKLVTMWRQAPEQTLLVIASVVGEKVCVSASDIGLSPGPVVDRYTGSTIEVGGSIVIEPWQVLWLEVRSTESSAATASSKSV